MLKMNILKKEFFLFCEYWHNDEQTKIGTILKKILQYAEILKQFNNKSCWILFKGKLFSEILS